MSRVTRYWHTARHLKASQIVGRLVFRFRRPRIDRGAAPALRALSTAGWAHSAPRQPHMLGEETFKFLNETRLLSDHGWDDPEVPKLWRYNLHYFDDLLADPSTERHEWHHALLRRWVRENPPGSGSGWESYPTSMRLVNWIKFSLDGNALPTECIDSLGVQARWLMRRLEFHLLGNHLFVNAKALVFAGLFFRGPEAERWVNRGLEILHAQMHEQILKDGGQFERSPMYHALALEDMLDLHNVVGTFAGAVPAIWRSFVATWPDVIGRMRHWFAAMCHPDGEISLFNDAAIGVSAAPATLEDYAERLGLGPVRHVNDHVTKLLETGYVRLARANAVAILDVGDVGPDYLPAHAHADTLSFELSVAGHRVFVNGGTSLYEPGEERNRQRSTAAHNTVVVAGKDSSEVWGGFRVARRARPAGLSIDDRNDRVTMVTCSHTGYRRLPGRPLHTRRWSMSSDSIVVEDTVSPAVHPAEARFHLHPSIVIEERGDNGGHVTLRLLDGTAVHVAAECGRLRIDPAYYHPQFGVSEPATVLAVALEQERGVVRIAWDSAA